MKLSLLILILLFGLYSPGFSQKGVLLLSIKIPEPFKNKFNRQDLQIKIWGSDNLEFRLPLNDTIINNLDTGSQIIDIHSSIRVGKYDKTFSSLIDFEIFKDSITRLTINFPEDCKSNRNALSITCPKCKRTDKVLPIVYGLTVPLFDESGKLIKSEPFYSGGCMVTKCDASWYCIRDRLKF